MKEHKKSNKHIDLLKLCQKLTVIHGRPQKKMQGRQKHSRDGHLSESYSQVSVSDRVTN